MRFTVSSLLLSLLLLACSDSPVDPSQGVRPGVQSTFTSTREVTSSDPSSPRRFDTLRVTAEGYLTSYQGKSDVLQYTTPGGAVRYLAYEANGDLSSFESSVFPIPDTWFPSPMWVRLPFGGTPIVEEVLLDTIDGDRGGLRLRTIYSAESRGSGSMKVRGESFDGVRLHYRYRYEIAEEGYARTVEGSSLYLPRIGWRGEIDEVTTTVVDGDTLSSSTVKTRLVDYVVTPIG